MMRFIQKSSSWEVSIDSSVGEFCENLEVIIHSDSQNCPVLSIVDFHGGIFRLITFKEMIKLILVES